LGFVRLWCRDKPRKVSIWELLSKRAPATKLSVVLSSRPTPEVTAREGEILGFHSLPALLSFGALLLLLATCPSFLSGFTPSTYDYWPQALFLLLGAGGALLLALAPDAKPRFDATALLLLAFLGWNALAMLTTVYRHDSWIELSRLFGALLTFFAVRALWKPERSAWIVGAWVLGMTWCNAPLVLDFIRTRSAGQTGPFYNQNLLANALAMTLPVALVFPVLIRRKTPAGGVVVLACLPLVICGLGLLITSSKGGFLAALVALSITVALVWRAKTTAIRTLVGRNRAIFLGGGVVTVVLFGLIAAKTVVPRLQMARGAQDNSTMFRAYIWRSTFAMAQAKPLTGFGPGSFPHVYPRYAQVSYTRSAHQSWAQLAAEGGFPALLLLLAAIGVALKSGWKKLKSGDWPLAAGMSGAIVALLVHGCVDSGFQTTSIVIFLAVALAVLTVDNTPAGEAKSRLDPFWLGALVLLALAGNQTQKAAGSQDAMGRASEFWQNGAPSVAVDKQREAVAIDPGSARLWLNLGRWQEASGADGKAAFETAAQLQPTVSANWANLARNAERHGQATEAAKFYERALENNPLDTSLLLERAMMRLGSKDGNGYTDLEKILSLWSQPYGLYPPVDRDVNLDFARATMLLAPRLRQSGAKARLQELVTRALADCERAKGFEAENEAMRLATGGEVGIEPKNDLDTLVNGLQQLQTALK
jgi:O-antigen ligase